VEAEINNHPDLQTVSLGSYRFKNIKRQVEVFALAGPGLVVPEASLSNSYSSPALRADAQQLTGNKLQAMWGSSIAVLPFMNMSHDLEEEHFGDGIAEDVLTALAGIGGLKVAARTQSFRYRSGNVNLSKIGARLGVTTILEGCVRRHNGRLRITTQLIGVADGFLIWSEKFDKRTEDMLTAQEEIAAQITERLRGILSGSQMALVPGRLNGLRLLCGEPSIMLSCRSWPRTCRTL
jgi:TolB-like protein